MIVYISCVDEVRYSFVSHLSESLCEKGINDVFVDSADNLSEEAQAKVERARVSVMVLPGNRKLTTASACLGKLGKIIRCQRNDDQVVVPVLYGVRKVNVEWLSELKKITGLSHFHQSRKECSDSELVEEIARDVYEKLYHIGRIGIYSKLLQIENMVNKQPLGIRCVGIWGMPGIGKTTLAKAFFDQKSGKFDASCFIEDFDKVIHEKGLYRLLGKQFLKEKPPDGVTTTKLSMLRYKLKNKRVLVVLDDVCNPLAAESFLGGFDWFGPESLIIITSRDKQVFRLCQVDQIYEVQGLNEKESLKLISLYVFRNDKEERNLPELSMKVIKYASGHPLALNIYGRELKGKKNLSEMETALLRLKQRPPVQIFDAFKSSYEKKLSEMETALLRLKPRLPFQIFDAFKSSYDTLNDSEKNIFLDIACFFRGENVDYVMQLLEGCDFFPHVGVDVLVDKGLVTFSENILQMHNLIQDVGQEIINGETIYIERRRRLWEPWSIKYLLEDNEHKRTLKRAQGTEDVEGIFLDTTDISFDIKPAAFDNMLNLRLLKIFCSNPEINHVINFPKGSLHSLPNELRLLHWDNYPLQSLPQKFDPRHLVEINMPYSQLQKLWGGTKNLEMLRTIRLCHSQELVDVDDLSKAQNLEVIDLQGCTRLQSFPDTCQLLHLRVVNLSGCLEIKSVPDFPPNIVTLRLKGTGIIKLPIAKRNGGELVSLSEFQGLSDDLKLERLKSLQESSLSCQDLGKLICLDLKDCFLLRSLPNMANLELLKVLDLSGCSRLNTIQSFPRNLKELYLVGTAVRQVAQLPQSLELLNAHGSRLRSLPNMANLELLKVLDLSGCSRLATIQSFPRNLKELYLAGTAVRQVPQLPQSLEFMNAHGSRLRSLSNMANLELLKVLDLSGCSRLDTIKGLPRNLKELDIAGTSVRGLPQLPQSLELLNSHGCVSLTSIRLDFEKLPMHYNFSNCFDLSPQVVNNFLVKALNNFKYIPRDHQQELNRALAFSFCAPSHAIQNSTLDLQQGSSVMARLNPSWRNTLVGFAMLVEVAFSEDFYDANGFGIRCVCRWKNKEGHSHKIERNLHCWAPGKAVPKLLNDHMFVFFDVNMRPSTADGNDPDICADFVVFEFFPVDKQTKLLYDSCKVTKCGVRVLTATTRDTSLENVLPVLSSDPMEFSGNEVEEVPRVSYDGLQEMYKALFLYIAGLFNDEDARLVARLIAKIIDMDVSYGLKVLADRSLIRVSSNGEIVMHCLLRKMGKEILSSESMLPGSLKDLARDFENVSVASTQTWRSKKSRLAYLVA
ncbi:probable WRKY transcription factor 16 isoform X1 [Arabidopsis lyrata subsp. lyrata]|uniref:probable WRKY transcription factor 16 isoform X1 n=1 Tax=Arabidopsis lyrata subsp. lyrata TaxID=81972 RepID=UPI000A29AEDB|nr:probable WRKY transcription factor 16 isoform X1 [Arabidopsis lyrata subsp. lyrata]|eukprot:XP_020868110.1 probable WRKY transcription factor 16 isoform X1 [Arabidopsis lyrata subsp. lyrata]